MDYVSDVEFDKAAKQLEPFAHLPLRDAVLRNAPDVFSIVLKSYNYDIWSGFSVGDLIRAGVSFRRKEQRARKIKETLSSYLTSCNDGGLENFLRHLIFIEMDATMDWDKVALLLKTHFPELQGKI